MQTFQSQTEKYRYARKIWRNPSTGLLFSWLQFGFMTSSCPTGSLSFQLPDIGNLLVKIVWTDSLYVSQR